MFTATTMQRGTSSNQRAFTQWESPVYFATEAALRIAYRIARKLFDPSALANPTPLQLLKYTVECCLRKSLPVGDRERSLHAARLSPNFGAGYDADAGYVQDLLMTGCATNCPAYGSSGRSVTDNASQPSGSLPQISRLCLKGSGQRSFQQHTDHMVDLLHIHSCRTA